MIFVHEDPEFRDLLLIVAGEHRALQQAHQSIAPMFWGERHSLEGACSIIRSWLEQSS